MPDLPLLDKILHSGELAYGNYTKQFEESLKQHLGNSYVITTNSFNTAVSVALSSYNIIEGDEVIVSPMACLASTQPFASCGLTVVWADIDPKTGTLCPDSVKQRISAKTKAIIHNHFCGYPGYIDEINKIGKENGLLVINDGIECFGSEYRGEKIGNCGTDVTVFSFNPVRIPNTIDGGAVVFTDKTAYERAILIRDCGINRSTFRDDLGEINVDSDILLRGFSATMSNVNGYIGCEQTKHIDRLIGKQRENAEKWRSELSKTQFTPIDAVTEAIPKYWVFGILAPNKIDAINYFRSEGYYASGVHVKNNVYSIFGDKRPLKGVNEFYDRFVALPSGWWVEDIRL